jgi:hypothetical protein
MVHFAAGILPVTYHHGKVLFLVGKDVRDNTWSDFGGKCERIDRNDPIQTAVRECYEETYGALLSQKALLQQVHTKSMLLLSHTQNNYPYYCYVCEVPYVPHLRNAFTKTLAFLTSKSLRVYIEKTDIMYVTWDALMSSTFPKRRVFEATLAVHKHKLSKIACLTPEKWPLIQSRAELSARWDAT